MPASHLRIDDLTGLPLRNAFLEATATAVEGARASGNPLALLVIDVDHFKLVNDTYGHLQGDDVLREVAKILRTDLRANDVPARYAGDEFVALLPDAPPDRAREVAERLCAAVRNHPFALRDGGGVISVTLSIGVAACPEHGSSFEALFAAADRALYDVKRHGRDGAAVATTSGNATSRLPITIERFVGRQQEMRTLVRLLEESIEGKARIVALRGEAGVGKTTLLRQLKPEVRLRGGALVMGHCQEADVQAPYAPWATALGALRLIDGAQGKPGARVWRELPNLVPGLPMSPDAPRGGGAAGSKYALLEEIGEYIRLCTEQRPLVIVLDDMQWADAGSWDVLESLIPQLDDERVLICLTIRAEEASTETMERRRRISRDERFREIELSRLTRDEMRRWVEAAFHRQDVGREFLAFLYRHTEGNPLFVVQVLRTLMDEGAIWHDGSQWQWRPVSELRLPVAMTDLMSRRLSRLSPESHAVLVTAAVIGREFDVDLAIEAGAGTEDELLDAIDEGLAASVLEPSAKRTGDRFAFTHHTLAHVLRDATNARRLKRIHVNVAQALERLTPDAITEIAVHYDKGGDAMRAYRYALVAAERAERVYAHQQATEFLRLAERNADTPAELAEVRVRLASVSEAAGRYSEAEDLCDLAIEWYQGRNDRGRALTVRRTRERLRALLGQPARQTLDACLALDAEAQVIGADAERVSLLTMISHACGRLGDWQSAERVADECVRQAEHVGEPVLLAESLDRLGLAVRQGDPERALEIHRRALALYIGADHRVGQARSRNNLSIAHMQLGAWREAQRELATAMELASAVGALDLYGAFSLNLGVVHYRCGEFEYGRELCGKALALFAAVKNSERQLYALYNLAHIDREAGDPVAAAELYEVASSLAQRIGQADVETGALAGAGLALLRQGREEPARSAYAMALKAMNGRDDWFQGREILEALTVHVLARDGHATQAVDCFDRARERAEENDLYGAAWLTGECADALERHAPGALRGTAGRYAARVRELGFFVLEQRLRGIAAPENATAA